MTIFRPASGSLRLCIAGIGALGTTFAVRFARAGLDVAVIARGVTLAAVRAEGLRLDDLDGSHRVRVTAGTAEEIGSVDVVFVCAKAQDQYALTLATLPAIGPRTTVVPIVNGIPWWYFEGEPGRHAGRTVEAVDPGGRLKALLAIEQIVGAVTFVTAERTGPGAARSTTSPRMVVGAIDHRSSARADEVADLLRSAGVQADVSERIRDAVWTKAIANLSSNPLSALTGATLREIYSDPALSHVARRMLDEGLVTAAAHGARIELDPEAFLAHGASLGDVRTSMLQDFDEGRPLELGAIGDAIVELAELKGFAMPNTRTILDLVRFKAAKSLELRGLASSRAERDAS